MRSSQNILLRVATAALLAVAFGACGGEGLEKKPSDGPMPDFSLTDVNTASLTFNQPLSPRLYEGAVSAWYFGYST